MRIGIIAKPNRPDFSACLQEVVKWLRARDCSVSVLRETVESYKLDPDLATEETDLPEVSDSIVVFGGDGTLLRAARSIQGRSAPILGVNLGSLGFLTEVALQELYPALENLVSGNYRINRRQMLRLQTVPGAGQPETFHALNDVVINKAGALARIISMKTHINSDFVTTFLADGLIISTPTGSTAYSLSAGGPILYPTLDSVVLTPICPHTLTNRPLVVPSESEIRVTVTSGEGVALTVDGQVGTSLNEGDAIHCTRADWEIELIQPTDRVFFDVLRRKLKWGER